MIGQSICLLTYPYMSHWLVVSTPLKKILVTWDDYSQYTENQKMFQTTNQLIISIHLPVYLSIHSYIHESMSISQKRHI